MNYTCEFCHKKFTDRKRPDRIVKFCSLKCYYKSTKIPHICQYCKKEFFCIKRNDRVVKYCSPKCYKSFRKENKPYNYRGFTITTEGYKHIFQPHHPRAMNNGYVPEQILVAEKLLNRFLNNKEVIHHINDNRLDNHPGNLYLFPNKSEHFKFHHIVSIRYKQKYNHPKLVSNIT